MKAILPLLLAASVAAPAAAEVATWKIDPAGSSAEFSVRHMMVSKVKGRFGKLSGTVVGDLANPATAKVDVTIDASSIDTENTDRDNHLRSADFFEVDKHPTIRFTSKRIEKAGEKWRMTGDLTMRGVTREVVLLIVGSVTAGQPVRASTRVNRKDFGLNWNRAIEAGGMVVGDQVDITLAVQLARQ